MSETYEKWIDTARDIAKAASEKLGEPFKVRVDDDPHCWPIDGGHVVVQAWILVPQLDGQPRRLPGANNNRQTETRRK